MKIVSASIDLTKINKSKIQTKDKNGNPYKNGAQYYNLTLMINDTPDKFGNTVSISDNQTKEEREAKLPKTYLGNGKVVWEGESKQVPMSNPSTFQGESDLPF